jgi:hypothetical protein
MLLRRQALVAEEKDEVLDEGAPDLRRRRIAEGAARSTPEISAPSEPATGRTVID